MATSCHLPRKYSSFLKIFIVHLAAVATCIGESQPRLKVEPSPWWATSSPHGWPYMRHHSTWTALPDPYFGDFSRVTRPLKQGKTLPPNNIHKSSVSQPQRHHQVERSRNTPRQGVAIPFRPTAFEYWNYRPRVVSSPRYSDSFSHISHGGNSSLSSHVTHSYFSLGDHRKLWEMKNEQKRKLPKAENRGILNGDNEERPKNYAAFVLGTSRSPLKLTQVPKARPLNRSESSYISQNTGKLLLRKSSEESPGNPLSSSHNPKKEVMASETRKEKKTSKKQKSLRRTKVVKSKINGRGKSKVNIGSHGRRSLEPHPGFLRRHTPDCALHTNRSFCVLDESYPRGFMLEQLLLHEDLLQKLWRPYSPLSSGSSENPEHSSRKSARVPEHAKERIKSPDDFLGHQGYSCSSHLESRRLSQAKNTRGEWKTIVNVEGGNNKGPHLLQTTTLEECKSIGSSCDLLPKGLATSLCVQRHTIHNLLTWDTRRGFYVDSYRLPTACVCYVSRINLSLIKSYIGDWKSSSSRLRK